jgi:uncharacterized membrane protein
MKDGAKFCPSCGASVDGKPAKRAARVEEVQASPQDAEENKGMAIIAYVIFFVPLITGDYKKSPFVKFHTNQGTILAIVAAGLLIVWSILWAIITSILTSLVGRGTYTAIVSGYRTAITMARISSVVTPILVILILVLLAIGILNVVKGRMKPLPVIGKFTIIK